MLKVAMLEHEFQKTRLKIALFFFLIIFAIGLVINVSHFAIEKAILQDFTEFRLKNLPKFKGNPLLQNIDNANVNIQPQTFEEEFQQRIDNQQDRTLVYSLILQLLLSILGAIVSYYASGIILHPIKENVENQKKFLKFASHELKTPIATISLIAESESENPKMQSISEEAEKLDNLTRKYLELLTTEHKNELKEIKLKVFVDNILQDFRNKITESNLQIENNIDTSIILNANETSLHAILRNILENATKYNKQNGILKITFENNILRIENDFEEKQIQNGYGVGSEIIKYHCNLRNWKFETRKENGKFVSRLIL